ncbi:hypothetical protein [Caballeronia sordidicola]|uniref:Putative bacteriophage protein n=1 Tax=Caballeronia sordidicola TaxID=196367 RepID=A0A242MT67_CABSO|nr:hypothetical protein [Caballeronia sordidicola]OTP74447.1 putative bacteriophage protein [Caballeronia sordidicola]
MSDAPILVVNVDDSQFDLFLEKYRLYSEAVKEAPTAWDDVTKSSKEAKGSFEDLASEALNVSNIFTGSQWGRSISEFSRISIVSAKSWHTINQEIEKSGKGMSLLGRLGLQLGAFGGVAAVAGLGVAGAALAAVPGAAKSLSDENRFNHENNLDPGEKQAFEDQYGPSLGASASDISKFADIKADRSQWSKIVTATAGKVSYQDIENGDPVSIWEKTARSAGEAYKSYGPNGGMWSASSGANDLLGSGVVRNAASRDNDWWNQQHNQYGEERDKLAIAQPKMDASTAFEQKWQSDLSILKRDFELAITPLEPLFINLATKATGIIDAFAKSPDLEKNIDKTIAGFERAFTAIGDGVDWWNQHVTPLMPGVGHGSDKADDKAIDAAKEGANLLTDKSKWKAIQDGITHPKISTDGKPKNPAWDWHHPFGTFHHDETAQEPQAGKSAPSDKSISSDRKTSNNVGNLRVPGSKTAFQTFDSKEAGVRAMDSQLGRYFNRDGLQTIRDEISKWAPPSENDTAGYIDFVAKSTGIKADEKLNWSDADVRSKIESAMIQRESANFRDLTPQAVKKIIATDNARSDESATASDTTQTKLNALQKKPAGVTESMAALPQAKGSNDDSTDSSSRGNRSDSSSMFPAHFTMPVTQINVTVPAGSNVHTSIAGMAY